MRCIVTTPQGNYLQNHHFHCKSLKIDALLKPRPLCAHMLWSADPGIQYGFPNFPLFGQALGSVCASRLSNVVSREDRLGAEPAVELVFDAVAAGLIPVRCKLWGKT